MDITIVKADISTVQPFRELFLQEARFQFVYDKCHRFGWADTYVFHADGLSVGYGSVWGEKRDVIFEFYLLPNFRRHAESFFSEFIEKSASLFVECQSNDTLLGAMLYGHCKNINAEAILFDDNITTHLSLPGITFRKKQTADNVSDDDGDYVLEKDGEILATGGFVWNYNLPYIDMYYKVIEKHRRRGNGSLMAQELKCEAYKIGRVPSARCNINNLASKATLLKAGMKVCGFILKAKSGNWLSTNFYLISSTVPF